MALKNKLALLKNKYVIISLVIVVLAGGGIFAFSHRAKTYHFTSVTKGSISETVSITGNTAPVQSVALSFGSSGIVSYINGSLGQKVSPGQLLAQLNAGDIYGQIAQAKANLEAQEAKLEALQAGSRPEDIASSQAAYDKAVQDLQNLYLSATDVSRDSYAKANDAVRTQLNPLFSNMSSSNPTLTYNTAYSDAKNQAEIQMASVITTLNNWQKELQTQDTSSVDGYVHTELSYLSLMNSMFNNISMTLYNAPGLSDATVATYKADVSAATSEVNTAAKNINTLIQNIASQKNTVAQMQSQLELKKAGSLPQDIKAQEAQVKSAEAALQSAQSKASNVQIVSPIQGIITQFDAKRGQFATSGTPLVSVISDNNLEIDAAVSETDLGKLAVGDKVDMTLDAFGGDSFEGTVFYIDPSATLNQGVVNYKIKASFNTPDSRVKSGLTVNLNIQTRHKDNVFILPQYAILQNDEGTFVEVLDGTKVKDIPVQLGIQDQAGNVEVISGVSEGQQVITVGLK